VGVGECALDHVGTLEGGLPAFAGKVPMADYRQMPGGQVATALHGVARLGLRAGYLGAVGDDDAAQRVLAPLEAAGVDVSRVKVVAGAATQLALILIDAASGERTIAWYRDPRLRLEPGDVDPAWIASARALHLDTGHVAAATAAARAAREAGVPVVLDADAHVPGIEALLPSVDFPIVSRSFAEEPSGDVSVSAALEALVRGGARMAVVTLGEEGAVARVGGRLIRSPGFEVAARDTTGAGDAFRAGFLWGLLEGRDAEGTLACAHAVAALNCTGLGAQGGLPDRAALEAFLAEREPRPWREPEGVRI
jgi:sugar/nucleoside kinase (ribokinase family)